MFSITKNQAEQLLDAYEQWIGPDLADDIGFLEPQPIVDLRDSLEHMSLQDGSTSIPVPSEFFTFLEETCQQIAKIQQIPLASNFWAQLQYFVAQQQEIKVTKVDRAYQLFQQAIDRNDQDAKSILTDEPSNVGYIFASVRSMNKQLSLLSHVREYFFKPLLTNARQAPRARIVLPSRLIVQTIPGSPITPAGLATPAPATPASPDSGDLESTYQDDDADDDYFNFHQQEAWQVNLSDLPDVACDLPDHQDTDSEHSDDDDKVIYQEEFERAKKECLDKFIILARSDNRSDHFGLDDNDVREVGIALGKLLRAQKLPQDKAQVHDAIEECTAQMNHFQEQMFNLYEGMVDHNFLLNKDGESGITTVDLIAVSCVSADDLYRKAVSEGNTTMQAHIVAQKPPTYGRSIDDALAGVNTRNRDDRGRSIDDTMTEIQGREQANLSVLDTFFVQHQRQHINNPGAVSILKAAARSALKKYQCRCLSFNWNYRYLARVADKDSAGAIIADMLKIMLANGGGWRAGSMKTLLANAIGVSGISTKCANDEETSKAFVRAWLQSRIKNFLRIGLRPKASDFQANDDASFNAANRQWQRAVAYSDTVCNYVIGLYDKVGGPAKAANILGKLFALDLSRLAAGNNPGERAIDIIRSQVLGRNSRPSGLQKACRQARVFFSSTTIEDKLRAIDARLNPCRQAVAFAI